MKLLVICLGFLAIGCTGAGSGGHAEKSANRLVEIDGYRDWNLVTDKPLDMSPYMTILCRVPGPEYGRDNPHLPKVFRVFVNTIGKTAMLSKTPIKFPEGSIIVKEKFDRPDPLKKASKANRSDIGLNQKPLLMTVMIKRDNAWHYYVTQSDGTIQKGDSKNCVTCHEQMKDRDFVFKPYVAEYPGAPYGPNR